MDNKKVEILEKIGLISKNIGIDSKEDKTILSIEKSDNPNKKTITLQSGNWDAKEPWFLVDENDKIHTLVSLETLLKIVETLKNTQEENFNLKLEKAIWQNVPVDFQDVWVVAMDEIKNRLKNKRDKKSFDIDIQQVINDIKKKHPNLFLNLDKYLSNIKSEGLE